MYNEHFGLRQAPFRITPDTTLFYTGGGRGDVLDALVYAIASGEGIVKVVGEVGTGKTMLCRMLEERLPDNVQIAYLANPSLTPQDILHAVALELGVDVPPDCPRIQVMHRLHEALLARHADNRRVVALVEEAQSMPVDTLEEIRLLSNLETKNEKLLQIVLFGQPELDDTLALPAIRQLRERITHSFHLTPLGRDEIKDYVAFRLRASGYRGRDAFSADAYKAMSRASEGLTRRVNIIADKAMLAAFAEDTHDVSARHVKVAIRDSEFDRTRGTRRGPLLAAAVCAVAVLAGAAGWYAGNRAHGPGAASAVAQAAAPDPRAARAPQPAPSGTAAADAAPAASAAGVPDGAPVQSPPDPAPAARSRSMVAAAPMAEPATPPTLATPVSVPATAAAASAVPATRPAMPAPASSRVPGAGQPPPVTPATPPAPPRAVAVPVTATAAPPAAPAAVARTPPEAPAPARAPAAEPVTVALQQPAAPPPPVVPQAKQSAKVQVPPPPATAARESASGSAADAEPAAPQPVTAPAPVPPRAPSRVATAGADDALVDARLAATRTWLQGVSPDQFSIQLLATDASQRRNLEAFLQRQRRAGELDAIFVYQTLINDRPWFGVLYGAYDSLGEARDALRVLPEELLRHDPFVRNIRDISISG